MIPEISTYYFTFPRQNFGDSVNEYEAEYEALHSFFDSCFSTLHQYCCCDAQIGEAHENHNLVSNHQSQNTYRSITIPSFNNENRITQTSNTHLSECYPAPEICFETINNRLKVTIQTERLMIESNAFDLNPNHPSAYSPLSIFSVSNRANKQFLGYVDLARSNGHALSTKSETGKEDFITLIGIDDHQHWIQEYGQEVAATIQHYLRQCLDQKGIEEQIGEEKSWEVFNELKGVEYFAVQIKNNKEVGEILLNIGLEKVEDIPGLNLRRNEGSDSYAAKIKDWVAQEIQVRKTNHDSSSIVSNLNNIA